VLFICPNVDDSKLYICCLFRGAFSLVFVEALRDLTEDSDLEFLNFPVCEVIHFAGSPCFAYCELVGNHNGAQDGEFVSFAYPI
jgi:hypothetical protein